MFRPLIQILINININRNYINNANSKLMIPDNSIRSSLSKCQINYVMNSPMIIKNY